MKQFKIGLQLHSVRDEMEADMAGTLRQVAEMGYDCVEFAGYYGHTAEEIRAMLDRFGLECVSVHQVPSLFLEEGQPAVDFLKTIGARYSAIPWHDSAKLKGTPDWENTVAEFIKAGELLQKNNIQLLYHNHEFEFAQYENKYLLEWIFDTLPDGLIQPEPDTCWIHFGGLNPAEYLNRFAGRIKIIHLKDFVCKNLGDGAVYDIMSSRKPKPTREEAGFAFRPVGHGVQDIPAILAASEQAGAEILIVEQDESLDCPPMEAARFSRDYLKSLGL